jgi:hypothetical protein
MAEEICDILANSPVWSKEDLTKRLQLLQLPGLGQQPPLLTPGSLLPATHSAKATATYGHGERRRTSWPLQQGRRCCCCCCWQVPSPWQVPKAQWGQVWSGAAAAAAAAVAGVSLVLGFVLRSDL